MRKNLDYQTNYLAQAEETEEIATLFCDDSAKAVFLKTAKAYRMLAGIPEEGRKSRKDR